jgi:hypothetical protein
MNGKSTLASICTKRKYQPVMPDTKRKDPPVFDKFIMSVIFVHSESMELQAFHALGLTFCNDFAKLAFLFPSCQAVPAIKQNPTERVKKIITKQMLVRKLQIR